MAGLRLCAFAIAGLAASVPADAASAEPASATGVARATVVTPLSAEAIDDLDFGMVAVSGASGRVVIAPMAGSAGFEGAAGPGCGNETGCPGAHPARFAVTGEAGRGYTVTVPASLRIPSPEGAVPLLVDQIVVKTMSRPAAGSQGALDSSGHDRFEVGGTLHLTATQPSARYRGDVPVIVTYF